MKRQLALFSVGLVLSGATAMACSDASLQASLTKDLASYKNIRVTVTNCVANIDGTVELYSDWMAINRKSGKRGATSVAMNVVVDTPVVEDADLASRVEQKLRRRTKRDITGSITASSSGGIVTVTGRAESEMVHAEAIRLVASTHGVKGIVDQIRLDSLPEVKMMTGQSGTQNPARQYPPDAVGPTVPRRP